MLPKLEGAEAGRGAGPASCPPNTQKVLPGFFSDRIDCGTEVIASGSAGGRVMQAVVLAQESLHRSFGTVCSCAIWTGWTIAAND